MTKMYTPSGSFPNNAHHKPIIGFGTVLFIIVFTFCLIFAAWFSTKVLSNAAAASIEASEFAGRHRSGW